VVLQNRREDGGIVGALMLAKAAHDEDDSKKTTTASSRGYLWVWDADTRMWGACSLAAIMFSFGIVVGKRL